MTISMHSSGRRNASVVLITAMILLTACSTAPRIAPRASEAPLPGVVVVGFVAKSGLKAPIDASRMSTDLAALLAGTGSIGVTPEPVVRQIIGSAPHDEMLAFYARHGRMAPYHVQRLMAADLPASQALAVRLESDRVEQLPLQTMSMTDDQGRLLADRERRVFTTRRTVQLSATLLDLRNGRTLWTRLYEVSPESVYAANHHVGGRFSTSLAAAMADTMVYGLDDQRHPSPPELSTGVLALLQEVAYNVPLQ